MKNGICPKCESSDVYASKSESHGIRIPLSWTEAFTELYVCAKCGFLEFYVQHESDLEKIKENLKKVKVKENL